MYRHLVVVFSIPALIAGLGAARDAQAQCSSSNEWELTSNVVHLCDSTDTVGVGTSGSAAGVKLAVESSDSTYYTGVSVYNTNGAKWVLLSNKNSSTYGPSKGFSIRECDGSCGNVMTFSTVGDVTLPKGELIIEGRHANPARVQLVADTNDDSVIYWAENTTSRGALGFDGGSGDLQYRTGATHMTNGTEVFRITSGGNVGIGSSSPSSQLEIEDTTAVEITLTSATGDRYISFSDGTNSDGALGFHSGGDFIITDSNDLLGAQTMVIDNTDGNVCLGDDQNPNHDLEVTRGAVFSEMNAGESTFTVSSSREYKENIQAVEVPDILERIVNIPVVTYDFKDDYCTVAEAERSQCKDRLGFIAEEFHQVFKRGEAQRLSGDEIMMALWLSTQRLAAENADLRDRVTALEKYGKR